MLEMHDTAILKGLGPGRVQELRSDARKSADFLARNVCESPADAGLWPQLIVVMLRTKIYHIVFAISWALVYEMDIFHCVQLCFKCCLVDRSFPLLYQSLQYYNVFLHRASFCFKLCALTGHFVSVETAVCILHILVRIWATTCFASTTPSPHTLQYKSMLCPAYISECTEFATMPDQL